MRRRTSRTCEVSASALRGRGPSAMRESAERRFSPELTQPDRPAGTAPALGAARWRDFRMTDTVRNARHSLLQRRSRAVRSPSSPRPLTFRSLRPGRDDCANAQPITGLGPHAFDNTSATATPGLADCTGLPSARTSEFLDARSTARITLTSAARRPWRCAWPSTTGSTATTSVRSRAGASTPAGSQIRLQPRPASSFGSGWPQGHRRDRHGYLRASEFVPTLNPNNGRYYEVVPENVPLAGGPGLRGILHLARPARAPRRALEPGGPGLGGQQPLLGRPGPGSTRTRTTPSTWSPSGGWVWINGTDATFTNWPPVSSNNIAAGGGAENYAEMYGTARTREENHPNTTHFLETG